MATTSAQVQQLYVAYLGRAADKAGLDYWLDELNASPATLTLENLRANFVNEQPEYANAYAGLSRQDTVIKVYNNLFGRAPDAAGLTYWTTGAGASVNADQLLTAFVAGASAADAKVITNKVLVSEVYTSAAAENYTQADAASILSGVTGNSSTVSAALLKLENGTLAGVAIPAGVAALKAEALADKAVVDFGLSKVEELTALNEKIVALNEKLPALDQATLEALDTPAAGAAQTYAGVDQAIDNAVAVRDAVSANTTPSLQAAATNAATSYTTARDTFTKAAVGNVDLAVKYEAAVAANTALTGADAKAVTAAEAKVAVDFNAASTGTALADANSAAGLAAGTVTNVATLYSALTDGTKTAAQVKAVADAFTTFLGTNGATDFNTLKTLAATDYTKNVAIEAQDSAETAITGATGGANFLTAFGNKATADTTLANAVAADDLVAQTKAIDVAHTALEESAAAVTVPSYVKDLNADVTGVTGTDLFHFADGVKGTDDFTITAFNKGDALYVGEGYTLATGVTTGTDGFYTNTNVSAKEVFFIQDSSTKVVSAVIETTAVGNAEGGSAANVAVIELAGITNLSDVSFSNGVILSSHVA